MPAPLDDLYALDTRSMTWDVIESKTAPFTARLGHCMVAASLLKQKPVEEGAVLANGDDTSASQAEAGRASIDGVTAATARMEVDERSSSSVSDATKATTSKGSNVDAGGAQALPQIKDVTPGFADGKCCAMHANHRS